MGAFIDGQEVLNFAEALAKGIDATGHVAVYGVYFDTNSAEIKAESAPAMQEIARLINGQPALKLLVELVKQ